jgi:flagellar biosynthesis protein FlhF
MNVKKFTGQTSREALRRVREALGADAVILSNRVVDGIVEILALANDDISSLAPAAPQRPREAPVAYSQPEPKRASLPAEPKRASYAGQAAGLAAPLQLANDEPQFSSTLSGNGNGMANIMPSAALGNVEMQEMKNEIRAMRGMMETQLAELAWSSTQRREPQKTAVLREILAAGFSASLARYLIEKLPADKSEADSIRWVKSVLRRNLATMNNENEVLERGGVFALVGPTGVGKTTSTAKLAARCVMRHGTDKLALITTDGYRIGGHEQLRIYGKILGVMVHSVKDEADLRIALKELKGKHTVLIDTVGVSQRDRMVAEQIAMLSGSGVDVKRLLCLNATSTGDTLNEVVRAYQGSGLAGCIMTKLDEAASIGSVLDVVIRQKLNMYYVSNGQRVPEDLHLADAPYLIDRAFKLKRESAPFQYQDAELPLVMANTSNASNDRSLREVNLG